jgi:HSP20 family protein
MLTRRAPERTSLPYRPGLDWLLEDLWLASARDSTGATSPPIDIRETDDAFVIEAEMPGIKPEDAEVTLEGRTLVIRGRYSEEKETNDKNGRYLLRERQSATYVRAITLPSEVDPNQVSCEFDNGELKVTVPKAAQTRSRRIPITAGSRGARVIGSSEASQQKPREQQQVHAGTAKGSNSRAGSQGSGNGHTVKEPVGSASSR